MPVVDILYSYYYDEEGKNPKVGGVQTYISRLAELCDELGFKTRIFQYANKAFHIDLNDSVELMGVPVQGKPKNKLRELLKAALNSRENDKYLTLFAADTLIPDMKVENSIAIQHGIFWDIPKNRKETLLRSFISKSITSYKIIKKISNVDKVVCVDNNFINWYRTQLWERNVEFIPILNFTCVPNKSEIKKADDRVNIVFARRFVDYRGTKLFAEAAKKILCDYENVYITFAGEGPDKEYISDMFKDNNHVNITKYSFDKSVEFHKEFHIAVVPTIGSEGTSLSLLEAMAAKCAVVCTNVGGMTDIVINGYNGLMINAGDVQQLYIAIKKLIDDKVLAERISENGYETVRQAFFYDRWAEQWKKVLKDGMVL